ncbi:hypothetical protein ACGYK5_17180 [Sulfitobacter sp. 1A16787]|uniref:hypothetical protein n=1 Tax=Sulfitobacter sp. 1A16787 TaxID=3368571 RepID=UPI003745F166
MAVSYPLSLPAQGCIRQVTIQAANSGAVSRSPFTFASQVFAYSGEMWLADLTLKPMRRPQAAAWVAFLTACRGRLGTFLLGDPYGAKAQGSATSASVTGSARDRSVSVSMSGTLLAGDYIQIGSGADASLHMVLKDRAGSGTLEIWPALRRDRSGAAVTLNAPKGNFRLASNVATWSVDQVAIYGLTIAAEEAL